MNLTIRLPKAGKIIESAFFAACFLGCIWIFASAMAEVVKA